MSSLEVSIKQGIGTVVIENAGKRNAIDVSLAKQLTEACHDLSGTESVGGMIIPGAGGQRQPYGAA